MTFMRFKTRLLIAFWVVLFPALCLPAVYFYHSLQETVLSQTEKNARHHLEFVKWMLLKYAPFDDNAQLDHWCLEVGEKLGYRITVIKEDGVVIADSAVPFAEVPAMENHAQRPEIAIARKDGIGLNIRVSATIHRELIYTATKIHPAGMAQPLYLRVAIPFSVIESRLADYGHRFRAVLAAIFLFTLVISYYLAQKLQAPVHQIIRRLQAIGTGDCAHHLIMNSGKEFYEISAAMNDMADKIARQVGVISEQKQELGAIIENLREGVMLLDQEGRVKTMNRALAAMAGCDLNCMGKRPLEIFLNPEIQNLCDLVLTQGGKHTSVISFEDDMYYEIYSVRIPEGAVMVFYDINERKRLDRMRQDFVANVSHELKTPLTSIRGYVETLINGKFSFSEEVGSFLNTIAKNANQMSNIVNDLLELTRLQEKPFRTKLPSISPKDCFLAALETCKPMAESKKIHLENSLPDNLLVTADESTLIRIFKNLIDNAIRYTPDGKTITVSADVVGDEIIFAVRDEGIGIPPVHQSRIFERFYRVNKERSRASGGTGLGLAICKNAVTGMGGRIWLKSPPSGSTEGTVFFFSLPNAHAGDTDNQ